MRVKSKVKFQEGLYRKSLLAKLAKEQSRRLILYAQKEIQSIGDSINLYNSANNMDRTGNLLDSLCWSVYYKGERKGFGYYRNETATGDSHVHEWSRPMGVSVNGHVMAQNFVATYKSQYKNGWELFFAVLAPYWGYWEKGFRMIRNNQTYKWQVMTQHYDIIKQDLSPTKVTFHNYIPS